MAPDLAGHVTALHQPQDTSMLQSPSATQPLIQPLPQDLAQLTEPHMAPQSLAQDDLVQSSLTQHLSESQDMAQQLAGVDSGPQNLTQQLTESQDVSQQDLTPQLTEGGSGPQSLQEAEQRRKARRAQAQRLRRAAQSAEQRAAVAAADAARHAAARWTTSHVHLPRIRHVLDATDMCICIAMYSALS